MTSEAPDRAHHSADVLFLIHDLGLGGAERVFVHYVNHLDTPRPIPVLVRPGAPLARELRSDVPLFTLSRRGSAEQGVAHVPGSRLLDRISRRIPGGAGLALPVRGARLRTLLRRHGARCVSTFLHKSHLIALFTRDVLTPDVRVVVNVHEVPSQHLLHHFDGPARSVMERAYRWVFSRADAVFAVAEAVRADLIDGFGAPPERVRVLHNPLDVEGIRRAAREPLDDADGGWNRPGRGAAAPGDGERPDGPAIPVVVGVGRLVRLKGFDVLLRALPRMRSGARLVLVGDGPERPALEALVRDLGVESRVRFTGERPNPWNQMVRGDVLALPSRSEAFPTVVGEALALGVPVVAAEASPGVSEYLEGGRCGLLVPPDDPAALAAALDRVLADRDLARGLADRGRARVEAFGHGRVEAYGRALREVMGR